MIGILFTLYGCIFMYPAARWLARPARGVAVWATTLALSLGLLSLILFWIGLIFGPGVDWRVAIIPCALIGTPAWLLVRPLSSPEKMLDPAQGFWSPLTVAACLVIVGISAAILFNAAYWGFAIDDAVTIYAWFGKQMALTGGLPSGPLYETYPMGVPLLYAYVYHAAGWIDEGLARLLPAAMSLGAFGAAYLVGRVLFRREVGLIAALLCALSPTLAHWASVGYVDLPTGFYFGLCGYFLARLAGLGDRRGTWRDALLAGFMAGMAASTKNSGLLIVASVGLWFVYMAVRVWRPQAQDALSGAAARFLARNAALCGMMFLAVAGPWYARNLLTAGVIVPPTGWTWLADRSLANLFPYLAEPILPPLGLVFTAGILYALWRTLRMRLGDAAVALPLIFFLPFFGIWWALFSYDRRFLFAVVPFVAVMGAALIVRLLSAVKATAARRGTRCVLAVLLCGLAVPAAWSAVDFKDALIRQPFMPIDTRYRVQWGDRYAVAGFLQSLPAGSRVWTRDGLLPYRADGVIVIVGLAPEADQADQFDYLALQPGEALPVWMTTAQEIFVQGGYRVYAR